jgi:hypothetical protein
MDDFSSNFTGLLHPMLCQRRIPRSFGTGRPIFTFFAHYIVEAFAMSDYDYDCIVSHDVMICFTGSVALEIAQA